MSGSEENLEPNRKIARFDDRSSNNDRTEKRQQSVNNELGEGRASDVSCKDGSTGYSASGLEDDLSISESDEPPVDVHEVIQSILSPREKRTLPIPRKPDYVSVPYECTPYNSDDSENQPLNKKSASSKKVGGNGKKKRGSVLSPVLGENSNKVDGNKVKKVEIEKRNMYIRIDQAQLDKYNVDFLTGNEKDVRKIVSGMCHSLRYWLAIKFCNLLGSTPGTKKSNVMTKAKVCRLLGIEFGSFKASHGKIRKEFKSFLDHDGLSPLEYCCLDRRTHAQKIKEYALNLDCPTVQHVISALK